MADEDILAADAEAERTYRFRPSVLRDLRMDEKQAKEIIKGFDKHRDRTNRDWYAGMANEARKNGQIGLSVLFDEKARMDARGQSDAEGKQWDETGFAVRAAEQILTPAAEFASSATGGLSDTAAAGVAEGLERVGANKLLRSDDYNGPTGAKAYRQGRQVALEANEKSLGGKIATKVGQIGGFIVPAGNFGRLGTALRSADKANRLSRATGLLMGGLKTSTPRLIERFTSSALNFGFTETVSTLSKMANQAGQMAALKDVNPETGQPFTFGEAMNHLSNQFTADGKGGVFNAALDSYAGGVMTGAMAPVFQGVAGKLKTFMLSRGGSPMRAQYIDKTLSQVFKESGPRATGRLIAARAASGTAEFMPFTMLANMVDENGNFTGGSHIFANLFSDDDEVAANARKELMVMGLESLFVGTSMQMRPGHKEGFIPAGRHEKAEQARILKTEGYKRIFGEERSKESLEQGGFNLTHEERAVLRDEVSKQLDGMTPEQLDVLDSDLVRIAQMFDAIAEGRGSQERILKNVTDRVEAMGQDTIKDKEMEPLLQMRSSLEDFTRATETNDPKGAQAATLRIQQAQLAFREAAVKKYEKVRLEVGRQREAVEEAKHGYAKTKGAINWIVSTGKDIRESFIQAIGSDPVVHRMLYSENPAVRGEPIDTLSADRIARAVEIARDSADEFFKEIKVEEQWVGMAEKGLEEAAAEVDFVKEGSDKIKQETEQPNKSTLLKTEAKVKAMDKRIDRNILRREKREQKREERAELRAQEKAKEAKKEKPESPKEQSLRKEVDDLKKQLKSERVERRTAEEQARRHPVSGMYNKRHFEEAQKHIAPGNVVASIDLANMGQTNKEFGHSAGDALIKLAGQHLKGAAKHHGLSDRNLFHIGGDEFTVIGTKEQVDAIMNELKGRVLAKNSKGQVTFDMASGKTFDEADKAMQVLKKARKEAAAVAAPEKKDAGLVKVEEKRPEEASGLLKVRPTLSPEGRAIQQFLMRHGHKLTRDILDEVVGAPTDQVRDRLRELGLEDDLANEVAGQLERWRKGLLKGTGPKDEPPPTAPAILKPKTPKPSPPKAEDRPATPPKETDVPATKGEATVEDFGLERTEAEKPAPEPETSEPAPTVEATVVEQAERMQRDLSTREKDIVRSITSSIYDSALSQDARQSPSDADVLTLEAEAERAVTALRTLALRKVSQGVWDQVKAAVDARVTEAENARFAKRMRQAAASQVEEEFKKLGDIDPVEVVNTHLKGVSKALAQARESAKSVPDSRVAQERVSSLERQHRDVENLARFVEKMYAEKKIKRLSIDYREGGQIPAPPEGSVVDVTLGDGRRLTGLVVKDIGDTSKVEPGRRFEIVNVETGERHRIRAADVVDVQPETVGDLSFMPENAGERLIEASKTSAYVTLSTFLRLNDTFVGKMFTTKAARGRGSADESYERSERLIRHRDLDKDFPVTVASGTKKRKGMTRGTGGTVEPVEWEEPTYKTERRGLDEAVVAEARSRNQRIFQGTMNANDHLLEALSYLVDPKDVKRYEGDLKRVDIVDSEGKIVDWVETSTQEQRSEKKARDHMRGEKAVDRESERFLASEGQARYFDPRMQDFNWFNPAERKAAEARLQERIDKAPDEESRRAAVRAKYRYDQHKRNYVRLRGIERAQRTAEMKGRDRAMGFSFIHPPSPEDVTPGSEFMVSLRSYNEDGEFADHAFYIATVTPERLVHLRRVSSMKEKAEWLGKHGVLVDPHRLAEKEMGEFRESMVRSRADLSESNRYGKIIQDMVRDSVTAIRAKIEDSDFDALLKMGFDKAFVDNLRAFRQQHPKDWKDEFEDFMMQGARKRSSSLMTKDQARAGAEDESFDVLPGPARLMVERAQEKLDPISGFPIKENREGQYVVRGGPRDGIVLGFFGGMQPLTARMAMGLLRKGGRAVRTMFDVADGVLDGSLDGVLEIVGTPLRNVLFESERFADMFPALENRREALQGMNSATKRFLTQDDPDGGIKQFLGELYGELNAVDHDIRGKIEPFATQLDIPEQLEAMRDFDSGKGAHDLMKDYNAWMNDYGQRAVKAGLLTQKQFDAFKDKYIHFGRWVHDKQKVGKRIEELDVEIARLAKQMRDESLGGATNFRLSQLQSSLNDMNTIRNRLRKSMGMLPFGKPEVQRFPMDTVNMGAVNAFRGRGFAKHRHLESLDEAIEMGLDTSQPWKLLEEGMRYEAHAVIQAEWFRRVAKDQRFIQDAEIAPKHWITVTKEIDKASDPAWRALVGKKMHPQMYEWLKIHEPTRNGLVRLYNSVHSAMKLAMTAQNPGNWLTQFMGNPQVLVGLGVPPTRAWSSWTKAFAEIVADSVSKRKGVNPEVREELEMFRRKKNWIDQPTDADREFMEMLERSADLDPFGAEGPSGVWNDVLGGLASLWNSKGAVGKARGFGQHMGRAGRETFRYAAFVYRTLDAAARVAGYRELRMQGMDDAQATKEINDAFDITHISRLGRIYRKLPFIGDSFPSVRAAQFRRFKDMTKGTAKMYAYYMGLSALWNSIAGRIAGQTDEEVDEVIESSIPNYNPFTHWIDSRTSFYFPGAGVMDTRKWTPIDQALKFIPGLEGTVEGLGSRMMGGRMVDEYGRSPGESLVWDTIGRNMVSSPAIEYLADQDRWGNHGVRDRLAAEGFLGTTGLLRAYIDNGALPALLTYGLFRAASGFTAVPRAAPAAAAALFTSRGRLQRTRERFEPWITKSMVDVNGHIPTLNKEAEPPKLQTDMDFILRLLGIRLMKPNEPYRRAEALSMTEGLSDGSFGKEVANELRQEPSSPEAIEAAVAKTLGKGYADTHRAAVLWGMITSWRDARGDAAERERLVGLIKRRFPDEKSLMTAVRNLGIHIPHAASEVQAILETMGLRKEFERPVPVKKIIHDRNR